LTELLEPLRDLTSSQIRYKRDKHRFIVLPAGRRSRKTLISKRKVLYAALRNKGHRYFHGAPTRQQAKQIFWKDLKTYTKYFRRSVNETELFVTLLNGSEIHVVGLDKPERIEGQPWNGCHITEIGNVKDTAWPENIRPLLSDTNGFALLDGVPEGRNHYYKLALYAAGGALPETRPEVGAFAANPDDREWVYYSWFSADVLPAAEIEAAKRQLDEKTYRQEYEGSFESFQGLAYYPYGNHNLKMCEYDKDRVVSVGMDFNVDPMTATLGHIISDTYYQFGEVYLNNSNTFEMRDHLLERFSPKQVIIYPDSTGKHESSNATESDLAILRKAGFAIRARNNPRVKDRVNAVNSLLKSFKGSTRYYINPNTCPKTINDFNMVERTDDGRLNKKQEEQGLKHITDALGYLINYNWPVSERGAFTVER